MVSATLGLLLAAVGCAAGAAPETVEPGSEPDSVAAARSERAAEIEALYRARTDSARADYTAADADFMRHMITHHGQAVVMARMAPTHGASPMVRTLAARIINGQHDEIRSMETWLRDRGEAVPDVHLEWEHALHDAAQHGGHMPGMLTAEQLRQLERARGTEFDRTFLRFMIEHHRGAVTMVHELMATDGAAQGDATFQLASDVQADQTTEIARMERMLSALPDDGGAPRTGTHPRPGSEDPKEDRP